MEKSLSHTAAYTSQHDTKLAVVCGRYANHATLLVLNACPPYIPFQAHVHKKHRHLCVGDLVDWHLNDQNEAVISNIQPRRSIIERRNNTGKSRPVAANIDRIFIVISNYHPDDFFFLDRYLVAAEAQGIAASIVFNKMDMFSTSIRISIREHLAIYNALDYPIIETSAMSMEGIDMLRNACATQTSVFVGLSGVGKSSLLNAIIPDAMAKVGELSEKTHKGRHTTSTATLFRIDANGFCIDSPGIQDLYLSHLQRHQVFNGFREIAPLTDACQFRDCQHDQEPGCAVQIMLHNGSIHASRKDSLNRLLSTLET